jgi:hypothetical protein
MSTNQKKKKKEGKAKVSGRSTYFQFNPRLALHSTARFFATKKNAFGQAGLWSPGNCSHTQQSPPPPPLEHYMGGDP